MKFAICQNDFIVGDLEGNVVRIIDAATLAEKEGAKMIVFPELTLTGYLLEDLLYRSGLHDRVEQCIHFIAEHTQDMDITIIFGHPWQHAYSKMYNAATVMHRGKSHMYFKQELPNYSVFDEKRYFTPGDTPLIVNVDGVQVGVIICEDGWFEKASMSAKKAGADMIVSLNASPFEIDKHKLRIATMSQRVRETGLPYVYVNMVGGQDELIFDGGSFVMNKDGVAYMMPQFHQSLRCFEYVHDDIQMSGFNFNMHANVSKEEQAYNALVLAVRDYINKNNSRGIVLGLSGGIDSAVTLAIAVDALGPDRCKAIMMPYEYTADISKEDAAEEAKRLGVEYHVVPIVDIFNQFYSSISPLFENSERDTTEENLQARIRGMTLMAYSNKNHYMVLTTGNKSEMAVGYATLYGDMAGGFDVLKDIPKTLVYKLAEYRNSLTPDNPPIPERVITRPPSAELAPDQTDEKSLCPYPILDEIIRLYVDCDYSFTTICRIIDYDPAVIAKIIKLIDRNEYKRRQAAPGPKITRRAFGKNRRFPIVNHWKIQ